MAIFTPFKDLSLGLLPVLAEALLMFEIVKRARLARVAFDIKPLPIQVEVEVRRSVRIGKAILFHFLTVLIIIQLN